MAPSRKGTRWDWITQALSCYRRIDPGSEWRFHRHGYDHEHPHAGIGLLTPADVHYGRAEEKIAHRSAVLAAAYVAHPERFPRGIPRPPQLPAEVWINKPKTDASPVTDRIEGSTTGIDALPPSRIDDLDPRRDRSTPVPGGRERIPIAL